MSFELAPASSRCSSSPGSARRSAIRSSSLAGLSRPWRAGPRARRREELQGLYRSFVLLAVPLFIVAANIMNAGTISDRLLGFCVAAVGRFRGGLGHVNVVASLIFSGMSGSAVADAAGHRQDHHRDDDEGRAATRGYAAAITAASATIGPIIPPSIPMVLYALVSNTSIGALFLARDRAGPDDGRRADGDERLHGPSPRFRAGRPGAAVGAAALTANAFPALLMPVILLYGIYGGVTTPTEAAAVAASTRCCWRGCSTGRCPARALYASSSKAPGPRPPSAS
jgi:hypothetical protein